MKLKVDIKTSVTDFNWVIRILNSSKTKDQLDVAFKCFTLWEEKHLNNSLSTNDANLLNSLRGKFWANFKNKNSRVSKPIVV